MPEPQVSPQLAQLAALSLDPGQVALWWLGQAGFVLRGPDVTILVDAFLSTGHDRQVPPPFSPEQARGLDIIACTHDHIDHLDAESLPALAAASPEARIIVPRPIVERVVDLGIARDRIIGAQPDEPIELEGVTIHAVPACHGVHGLDAYSFGEELSDGLIRFLGYVFDLQGAVVYHAGDTLAYQGLVERLRSLRVSLALLPINGRDYYREAQDLVGNMDPRDAAHVAADAHADLLIPIHWDMFKGNQGYPGHLVQFVTETYPGLAVLVPGRDEPFVYTALPR